MHRSMALKLILSSLSLLSLTMASEQVNIADLPSVINTHLSRGERVTSYTSQVIRMPGETYGTIYLAISANVRQSSGKTKRLALTAKLPPINNDDFWEKYRPKRACVTENALYKYFAKEVYKLEEGFNMPEKRRFTGLAKYYGSRISLDPYATEVDHDAILVLEDVQHLGFKNFERSKLLSESHITLAVETMARFHASAIGLRENKPEVFDKYVLPYVNDFNILLPEEQEKMADEVRQIIKTVTNNDRRAMDGIDECIRQYEQVLHSPVAANDTRFTTILISDLWNTNFMAKYDAKNKLMSMKIFNLQYAQYGTMMHDFHFLLFTSVEPALLKKIIFDLFGVYHTATIKRLKTLRVDLRGYQFAPFSRAIKRTFPKEFPRIIYRLKVDFEKMDLPENIDASDESAARNYRTKQFNKRISEILDVARIEHFVHW